MSGGSITTTFYIRVTAPTAEICSPTPHIQKLVTFKKSKRVLYAVCTWHRSVLRSISPIGRHQTTDLVNCTISNRKNTTKSVPTKFLVFPNRKTKFSEGFWGPLCITSGLPSCDRSLTNWDSQFAAATVTISWILSN